MVQEEKRAAARNHQKVLKPLIVEIREQSASATVQHAHRGFFSHILERSIASIAIEPVGKSRRLTDIQVIPSVAVEVSHGQTVVSVYVNAAGSVQNRAPTINSVNHLIFV